MFSLTDLDGTVQHDEIHQSPASGAAGEHSTVAIIGLSQQTSVIEGGAGDSRECLQIDGRSASHLGAYRRDFTSSISLRYCCSVNIVVGFAENIIATVTDSAQLKKNNELMKYIKNSDCSPAPGP